MDPSARIDEILAINSSAETRQGRPMHPSYLDEAKVRRYFERSADVFGVTDTNGALRAYICVRICGEVACVERILGHADALKSGVMWVLVTGDDPGTGGAEADPWSSDVVHVRHVLRGIARIATIQAMGRLRAAQSLVVLAELGISSHLPTVSAHRLLSLERIGSLRWTRRSRHASPRRTTVSPAASRSTTAVTRAQQSLREPPFARI